MDDDEVLLEAPSSPLSTALDAIVLDAISRATDDLDESLNRAKANETGPSITGQTYTIQLGLYSPVDTTGSTRIPPLRDTIRRYH
jgi:hypothetical protein